MKAAAPCNHPADGDPHAMKHHQTLLLVLLSAGCASTEAPPPESAAQAAPRRRRRRRVPDAGVALASAPAAPTDPTAPSTPRTAPVAGGGGGFGSPVVTGTVARGELTARWLEDGRVLCDGEAPAQIASSQSPYEPSTAMIVRALQTAERAVLACAPAVPAHGRLAVRVRFSGGGAPQEVAFPEGTARADATCVAQALCGVRMAAFRAPFATIPYDYVVQVATDG